MEDANRVQTYLREAFSRAEGRLKALGRSPGAWSLLHPRFEHRGDNAEVVAFGSNLVLTDQYLGEMSPKDDETILPSRRIPVVCEIVRQVRDCEHCRKEFGRWFPDVSEPPAYSCIALAQSHHPDLFSRYLQELHEPVVHDLVADSPAWTAAQAATVAKYAIDRPHDRAILIGAARFVRKMDEIEAIRQRIQLKTAAATTQGKAVAVAEQHAVKADCGRKKRGVRSPHVQVIFQTVKHLMSFGRQSEARDVIRLLLDEVPDEIRDGILPVILRAERDVPRGVELDTHEQRVHFHFTNRDSASMTWRSFQNQVSAAKKLVASGD